MLELSQSDAYYMAMKHEEIKKIKSRAKKIIARLKKTYPDSGCSLVFRTPHQLLVSTILSAQCTDERVNMVTKDLFKKYSSPKAFANADLKELEDDIRPTGFFHNKAKAIKESARILANDLNGEMPRTLDELVKLPGVGRKTGSVVLGAAFGLAEGVVVDTHVMRLSRRMGFTAEKDPVKIERDLIEVIPKTDWIIYSHLLIDHGRAVCKARKPACLECQIADLCPSNGLF